MLLLICFPLSFEKPEPYCIFFWLVFFPLDDQEPNPETLLSRSTVLEFYTEMAKLKSLGVLHKVNTAQVILDLC